ncbi:Arm domain-containing protein [Cephalotus follicularis]|uniref:Arm domain-containing protein n=1 Tax=Cephalotus follicularis TaxID=3775 RepID=A0A1Q3B2I3_CEPFO|nr:Arm domain-containing protein [Cephalotus follicularis]
MAGAKIAISTSQTVTRNEEDNNNNKSLQEELSLPIILSDRVIKSAQEAESNKQDCSDLARQVDKLSQMLRSLVRLSAATQSLYDRPVRRVVSDVTKNLERALTLTRKCKHSGVLRQVFSITTAADFRKAFNLLDSSAGDLRWLLTIFDDADGTNLSLPPIASNDPILAWVWSYISTVQMGQLRDRVDAANELASLARDNDRNKKIIVEEGGVLPLLKLLKEGDNEGQLAAVNALLNLATDQERVRVIVDVRGIPIIVAVLGDSPMKIQIVVANLVARMADLDNVAQEEFVRENVTKPLVSLLSMDMFLESASAKPPVGKTSIHSIVQMNKELATNKHSYHYQHSYSNSSSDGSSRGGNYRKERELELPEVKLKVKVSCAGALWKLSKGCLSNSRKITETKGLICLAKLIGEDRGELRFNCLMAIMEITVVAEENSDLRRSAFKTNSPAAKAVLDELLKVIREENDPTLKIVAIRSIGCLARTFPAKETRIIGPLVAQLGSKNVDVATEAAIALGKFVCPDNFNCSEHSKAIFEFEGVPPLMRLLRVNEGAQIHGLVLLCYLALNGGNSKALEQARALNALEGAARHVLVQHPDLRDLFARAIHHLTLYQAGGHPHIQSFAP